MWSIRQRQVGVIFLRVYISGDNGNSYSEIENLTTFSLDKKKRLYQVSFRELLRLGYQPPSIHTDVLKI